MLVNEKLDGWVKGITFQDCRLYWPFKFLMAQLKQSWQYWHCSIEKRSLEIPLSDSKISFNRRKNFFIRYFTVKKVYQMTGYFVVKHYSLSIMVVNLVLIKFDKRDTK